MKIKSSYKGKRASSQEQIRVTNKASSKLKAVAQIKLDTS